MLLIHFDSSYNQKLIVLESKEHKSSKNTRYNQFHSIFELTEWIQFHLKPLAVCNRWELLQIFQSEFTYDLLFMILDS